MEEDQSLDVTPEAPFTSARRVSAWILCSGFSVSLRFYFLFLTIKIIKCD